jgi:hypothetical protein
MGPLLPAAATRMFTINQEGKWYMGRSAIFVAIQKFRQAIAERKCRWRLKV